MGVAYAGHASSYVHFPNLHPSSHGYDDHHDDGHHDDGHHDEHHDHYVSNNKNLLTV